MILMLFFVLLCDLFQLTLSGDEGDRSDHRAASRGGLDYYDTGKDLESRGVVDEDGMSV